MVVFANPSQFGNSQIDHSFAISSHEVTMAAFEFRGLPNRATGRPSTRFALSARTPVHPNNPQLPTSIAKPTRIRVRPVLVIVLPVLWFMGRCEKGMCSETHDVGHSAARATEPLQVVFQLRVLFQ